MNFTSSSKINKIIPISPLVRYRVATPQLQTKRNLGGKRRKRSLLDQTRLLEKVIINPDTKEGIKEKSHIKTVGIGKKKINKTNKALLPKKIVAKTGYKKSKANNQLSQLLTHLKHTATLLS